MSLKILIPISFLIAPIAAWLMPASKDSIIAGIECTAQLWLLSNLAILCYRSWQKRKLDQSMLLIASSLLCILLADWIYISLVIGFTHPFGLLGDCLYSCFAISLLLFLVKKLDIFKRKFSEWGWFFLGTLVVDAVLSYIFLLEPYYRLTEDTLAWKINGTFYMGLTIVIFSLILPFAFRVSERRTFWFLNALILLLTADFAIRYQGAFVGMSSFSWAEFAWCSSFIGLAWLLQLSKGRESLFQSEPYVLAPFVSIRSLLTLSICGANSLFLIGILCLKAYSLDTALDLTSVLMLLFLFWTIANEFSIWLATDLGRTLKLMFKSKENSITEGAIQFHLEKVADRNPVYEISKILQSYNDLVDQTNQMMEFVLETSKNAATAKISSQVIHDIRSPLAALEMVVKGQTKLTEERRIIIRSSIGRIKDIINILVQRNTTVQMPNESASVQLLSSLIEALISEKRMQFRSEIGVEIDSALDESSYGIFSKVNTSEFLRLLSNIINNAVESLDGSGRVTVSLVQTKEHAMVSVVDNGCGIPSEILNVLGRRGQTYGKKGGLGLGLYHARTTLESWGGCLKINSTEGIGTQVDVMIPLSPAPGWFVERLKAESNAKVVILDDDVSIHQIWEDRFNKTVETLHFGAPNEFVTWVTENHGPDIIYLVDYELLGFEEVGLSLIESLKIQSQSILVTSHYEEEHIRTWCERLGVPLIPKGMAGFVPIEVSC